ncbi:head maturation protease, ClpP-related [Corynebacterium diphtheriae]|uniref:head maturation protease, ClpP-related n=1 Tax=Corynebacterium diphtheriae TaxID=1717 RepID=UPI0006987802|nr:head maturation protease, ClpP-related [Corynebacterium diphtheriae]
MPHRIDIFDDIGGWGITSSLFASWLKEAGGAPVEVHINSYGGDVFEGITIMNALRDYEAEVTVIVDGIAASAASYIAVGGADLLIMQESASLMVHDAWADVSGNSAEIRKQAEELERMSDVIAQIYADKSGTPVEEWREAMAEDAYFSAEEAVLVGLADEIRTGARVSNTTRTRMFNAMRFASRDQAPEPALVRRARAKKEEGKAVNLLNSLAKELNAEGREDELKASLLAFMNSLSKEEPQETETVEGAVEEAPAEDEPNEEAPEVEESVEDDAPADESPADSDSVLVPRAVYEDLLAAHEKAGEMVAAERERALVDEVDAWIAEGRFSAARRAEAITAMGKDADMARASWGKLPKGSVNRKEAGYGGQRETAKAVASPFSSVKF